MLSTEARKALQELAKPRGALAELLLELQAQADDLQRMTGQFNLYDPEQLQKAQEASARARGFLLATERIEELLEEPEDEQA